MNQLEIDFNFQGQIVAILCSEKDLMKDIINKYSIKSKKEINSFYLLYAGDKIDENSIIEKIIRSEDKNKKKIEILVFSKEDENPKEIESKVKSTQVICPECGEIALINFKNYNLSISRCKNNHKYDKILLENFEKTQIIDESKIICEKCGEINKSTSFHKVFYICQFCQKKLCPLCKNGHDKTHNLIKYEEKDSICFEHRDNYNLYCKTCNKNLCASCENEHPKHEIISLGKLIPKEQNLNKKINDLKDSINKFKDEIKNIINILNKVKDNMDKYYLISKDIMNSFNIRTKNYEMLSNINEINNFDDIIMKDIDKIIKEEKIYYKFNYIFYIYCMMISKEDNILKKEIFEKKKIVELTKDIFENNLNYINYLYADKIGGRFYNIDDNDNGGNMNNINMNINMNYMNNMNNMNYINNMNYMNNMNNMNYMNNMNFMNMTNMGGMYSNKEKILTLEEEYHNLNSNKLTVKDFADFYKKLKPKYCMLRFLFPKFEDILDIDLGFNGIKLSNDNIFEWQFTFKGPRYSPYSGGLFHLKAFIPKDYPINPPEICFITPIYHLEVNYHHTSDFSERLGHISSPILDWWDSKTTMKDVILSTLSFFYSQITPESPYGLKRAKEFFNNNSLFEKKIKFFTHKYADPSLPYKEYNNSWDFSYTE